MELIKALVIIKAAGCWVVKHRGGGGGYQSWKGVSAVGWLGISWLGGIQ